MHRQERVFLTYETEAAGEVINQGELNTNFPSTIPAKVKSTIRANR